MSNSYWGSKGTHQDLYNRLNELIPVSGSVANPRTTNKALERLRIAANVYHDVFNNGLSGRTLVNRGSQFAKAMGFAYRNHVTFSHWTKGGTSQWDRPHAVYKFDDEFYVRLEAAMDRIIQEAAAEQGIR